MTDLTSVLIPPSYNQSFNESSKQSMSFNFESGTAQTIGNKSISRIVIDIQYQNISEAQYQNIDASYQQNHSTTFQVNLGKNIDPRLIYGQTKNGVFAFTGFHFDTSTQSMNGHEKRYNGKVTLTTSVIFNYPEFQKLYNEPSTYSMNESSDISMHSLLDIISPHKVTYGYRLNQNKSNSGESVASQRDLKNAKKTWVLEFFCVESDWIELITFFRKKGGINPFGMPKEGYFVSENQQLIKARFANDTMPHQRAIGGVYQLTFKIEEVK